MFRYSPSLIAASAAAILAGCSGQEPQAPAAVAPANRTASLTSQPAQAKLMPGVGGVVRPIITVGDALPDGSPWQPIPDGLGGYIDGGDLILYSNHELSSSGVKDVSGTPQFTYSRVSRLTIDRSTLAVKDATYVIDGSEQYARLCSATFVDGSVGFPSGYFLTGEESTGGLHDGIQLAIDKDGTVHELPWMGRFSHENATAVPYSGKVVVIGTDDTSGKSELYMYVADDEAGFINGTGKLYVFASGAVTHSGYLNVGQGIQGSWVEVPNPASLSSSALQTTVQSLGALPFVRLEDSDYDHRPRAKGGRPRLYFVDTGSASVMCGAAACDAYGSIYTMDLNPRDPAGPAELRLVGRSQGAQTGWSSLDNIAAGVNSLMAQEDPANSTFAGQRAPRIWQFRYTASGLTNGQAVAELENPTCNDVAGTCWESSGIIDASKWFGPGAWLFDVQAHTLPFTTGTTSFGTEGGQLLFMRITGS